MNKEIVLIGNPIAGGNALKKIKRAVSIIKNRGFNVRLMLTEKKGDAELFARRISAESPLPPFSKGGQGGILVIAAGGDGTYNEVVNGIAGSNIPMSIIPLGTTSVLAKELNIPDDVDKALDVALNGRQQTVSLGMITLQKHQIQDTGYTIHPPMSPLDKGGIKGGYHASSHENSACFNRYFLLMAGIGFDGEVVFGVNEKIKRYSGKGAYILSGIKTLLRYNPTPITIDVRVGHDDMQKLVGYTAIVSNASCYGGSFKIAPDARLTEPYLYIFVIHNKSKFQLMRCIAGILRGRHLKLKDISYLKASEIKIEGSVHIQIDGDYLGTSPAKIEIVPSALRLVF
jgi:YegS/Rv2252/BmrU family lipid kinase